ncbi:PAP2 superfamily protein [Drepanopeziza brunnea f. sp. 'multigermtubi' MB_m1]|uniref:PAP2 superfamily protein n=1 Tax=Marssonina brunnea f. sp. multigermtubi (strain MB_m1) TaxID=1072389 RepID=K1XD76_MARBU|nr:PAP2 superfamily protein [Drepanopeziza brunnea f. sp. 'multigermtubi' MB_m1]EKD18783.1 PAP2 superfamily protein [Drepanopeziza brunnea f. sp. 'multigermtubi' MB_m1]
MNFFKRRQRDPAEGGNTSTTTASAAVATSEKTRGPVVMSMSKRPTFGQWLKVTWLDIFTMAAMGMIGLGVYTAHPAPSRSFPVVFQDGEIVYPQFAYPLRKEIVPIWAAALLAALVPIFFFLVMQIRIRSFWDVNNATIGLLYSLITAAVFQVFLKWLIGGLRPHFLAVCKPNITLVDQETGNGFRQIMYDRTICTGDESEIDDSLESFPSGHSTAAFAGFVFLYLYLNAKLKVWSNYHPAMWKLIATYAPILGATLIAGALTIDEYHNWYDCVAGAIIGTVMAFSAYRMVYASIWDWRTNHIPLNRAVPFPGAGTGKVDLEHAMFTRQAGWGYADDMHGGMQQSYDGHVMGHGNGADMVSSPPLARTKSGLERKPVPAPAGHPVPGPENMV